MSEFISVAITSESVQVAPGESVTIDITVQNASNVVDVLYVEVLGLDSSWYQLSLAHSSLFPGDQSTGTLTITPPKTSAAVAASYPFTIKTSSQKDPTQDTSLNVNLDVLPFYSFEMDLHPQKATGARGEYRLSISNTGNADLNIDLAGRDPEDLCRFSFDHQRPRVSPGQKFEVAVLVEPGKRPFKGRAKGYRFTLTGTPDPGTAEPVSVPAELDATARLPEMLARLGSAVLRRPRAPQVTAEGAPVAGARRVSRGKGIAAGLVLVAVIAVVIVAVVLVSGGGSSYEGAFALSSDETITFGFEILDTETVRIEAKAKWEQTDDALLLTIRRPDGSFSDPLPIARSGDSVTFLVAEETAKQGRSGWAIGVTNTSATERADGTLKLSFSK